MPANGSMRVVNVPAGTQYTVVEVEDATKAYTYLLTVGELQDYILETACMYPYVYTYTPYVHVDTVSNLVFRDVWFFPHMSNIADNFVSHA